MRHNTLKSNVFSTSVNWFDFPMRSHFQGQNRTPE